MSATPDIARQRRLYLMMVLPAPERAEFAAELCREADREESKGGPRSAHLARVRRAMADSLRLAR